MGLSRRNFRMVSWLLIVLIGISLAACSGHSAKRAGEGAGFGAVVGAAGGMVSALVFGGDVGEATARGAVWGATTGAVAGGISGALEEKAMKAQQEKEREKAMKKLKAEIGEDTLNGLAALVDCKHEVAMGYARTAVKSKNKNYALAGLWLEIIAYADNRQNDKARALFPDLITHDPEIGSQTKAEEMMRKATHELMNIRQEFDLPRTCS